MDAVINKVYDRAMYDRLSCEYWGESDFMNLGYWETGVATQREACERLMERLLAFLPGKSGTILDAACGKGATTRHLLKHYAPERVTGINISDKQLETCRVNAPGCNFLLMNAVDLKFPDATFDSVISVEAAFHFNTRERFLREAHRVLKPGGSLVLSDMLFTKWWERLKPPGRLLNFVESPAAYAELCRKAGFRDAEVVDATAECAGRFLKNLLEHLEAKRAEGAVDAASSKAIRNQMMIYIRNVRHYLLVAARKG